MARLHLLPGVHVQTRAPREAVTVLLAGVVGDDDRERLLGLLDRDEPVLLG